MPDLNNIGEKEAVLIILAIAAIAFGTLWLLARPKNVAQKPTGKISRHKLTPDIEYVEALASQVLASKMGYTSIEFAKSSNPEFVTVGFAWTNGTATGASVPTLSSNRFITETKRRFAKHGWAVRSNRGGTVTVFPPGLERPQRRTAQAA